MSNDFILPEGSPATEPSSFLTGQGILNDALSLVQDQTTGLRTKALKWLNIAAQKLALERDWQWMNTSATPTPGGGTDGVPGTEG